MANGNMRSEGPIAAVRLATWILPPHRKDWAAAMLNEMAYVGLRRIAWRWVLGCILFAIRERASYQLTKTFATHRILKTVFGLSAAFAFVVAGVWMVQKPYQQERILITIFHHAGAPATHHTGAVQ